MTPGYKKTEVGVIPDEWEVVTAMEACTLVVDCKNRTPPIVADSDFAVVRTPNVRDGKFVLEDLRFTDEASYREWTARAVPQFGDIMITREAPLGEVCAVPARRKVCLGQRMMLYRPSTARTISAYLLYSLMSFPVRANLLRKIGGSTVGHAKVDDIRFLQLPLPPLHEQCAIAEALKDVDALLDALDRLISKKRDLKQAAVQQLLTGQIRLPGFHGDWNLTRLKRVVTSDRFAIVDGPFGSQLKVAEYVRSGIPVVEMEHLRDDFITERIERCITPRKFDDLKRSAVYPGDIIISKTGSLGKLGVVPQGIERGLITSRLAKITLDSSRADRFFVFQYLLKLRNENYWEKVSQGGTMQILGIGMLQDAPIPDISVSEQSAIATVLLGMDAELVALEQRRDKTCALKQAMMQELLTGRTRLISTRESHA